MDLFEQALIFAMEKHRGQTRKDSAAPYLLHPMEVAAIAATMTDDPEVLAAALLHDTVEDAGVDPQEITDRFGDRVAELVFSETEDRPDGAPDEASWFTRKASSLNRFRSMNDRGVRILWISDKLANLRSFSRQYDSVGTKIWEYCHQRDPAKQAWYYRSIAEAAIELRDTAAYREFITIYRKLFSNEKEL